MNVLYWSTIFVCYINNKRKWLTTLSRDTILVSLSNVGNKKQPTHTTLLIWIYLYPKINPFIRIFMLQFTNNDYIIIDLTTGSDSRLHYFQGTNGSWILDLVTCQYAEINFIKIAMNLRVLLPSNKQ